MYFTFFYWYFLYLYFLILLYTFLSSRDNLFWGKLTNLHLKENSVRLGGTVFPITSRGLNSSSQSCDDIVAFMNSKNTILYNNGLASSVMEIFWTFVFTRYSWNLASWKRKCIKLWLFSERISNRVCLTPISTHCE